MQKLSVKQLLTALKKRGYTQDKIEAMVQEVTVKNPRLTRKLVKAIEDRLRIRGRVALWVAKESGSIFLVSEDLTEKFWLFPKRGLGNANHPLRNKTKTGKRSGPKPGAQRVYNYEAVKAELRSGMTAEEVRKKHGMGKTLAYRLLGEVRNEPKPDPNAPVAHGESTTA